MFLWSHKIYLQLFCISHSFVTDCYRSGLTFLPFRAEVYFLCEFRSPLRSRSDSAPPDNPAVLRTNGVETESSTAKLSSHHCSCRRRGGVTMRSLSPSDLYAGIRIREPALTIDCNRRVSSVKKRRVWSAWLMTSASTVRSAEASLPPNPKSKLCSISPNFLFFALFFLHALPFSILYFFIFYYFFPYRTLFSSFCVSFPFPFSGVLHL